MQQQILKWLCINKSILLKILSACEKVLLWTDWIEVEFALKPVAHPANNPLPRNSQYHEKRKHK